MLWGNALHTIAICLIASFGVIWSIFSLTSPSLKPFFSKYLSLGGVGWQTWDLFVFVYFIWLAMHLTTRLLQPLQSFLWKSFQLNTSWLRRPGSPSWRSTSPWSPSRSDPSSGCPWREQPRWETPRGRPTVTSPYYYLCILPLDLAFC